MSDLILTIDIQTPPDRVFEALTNEQQLKVWFCEHADISLDERRFDFWGRYTPGRPTREQGRHEISSLDPGKSFSYRWYLRQSDTEVTFRVKSTPTGSAVALRHSGLPRLQPSQSSLEDYWTHSLESLRSLLERGAAFENIDFGQAPRGDVQVSVNIEATPEQVFDALIDPEQLERYIASEAIVEPRVGGRYSFGWTNDGPMRILELEPSKKLAYSWRYEGEPDTVTTWTLEGSGGRTRLTVVQSGFAPDRDSEDYFVGWTKFIYRVKDMVERGPEWKRSKRA